ncbi:Crp/Fnr family transcriptional regulator [Chitinophaga sp. CF418]|uniref:Crp/Fnr family transcriptional regulator n=1 Tax=Chitinophaga sp. CF418 TaxID=1855287 RepID=UPI000911ED7F|nr:Crp/Fnr family transcriptional regulator [Chitinophaga sp. CF418]SHM74105.1 cAMP-binding domain of CRP or a regulatory subunit of cAMP-dependent protein kinases [Chitinophaga sp. CF418]
MYEVLINHINSYSTTQLNENDIAAIKDAFKPGKIKKKEFLLKEGEIGNITAFVINGALRQYTVDEKGAEHIVGLFIENWWASDRESWTTLIPSHYNIDAWEDTDVLLLTRDAFNKWIKPIPAFIEMTLKLQENNAFSVQKRLHALISLSAEKRYINLINAYPQFLQRFPQHIIASYLGITKETLSRVRRQLSNK